MSWNMLGSGIVLVIIELLSFIALKKVDIPSIFALWILLFGLLMLTNLFSLFEGRRQDSIPSLFTLIEDMFKTEVGEKRSLELNNSTSLVYLFLVFINVFGYFISNFLLSR